MGRGDEKSKNDGSIRTTDILLNANVVWHHKIMELSLVQKSMS
jgi:hypothetical protein